MAQMQVSQCDERGQAYCDLSSVTIEVPPAHVGDSAPVSPDFQTYDRGSPIPLYESHAVTSFERRNDNHLVAEPSPPSDDANAFPRYESRIDTMDDNLMEAQTTDGLNGDEVTTSPRLRAVIFDIGNMAHIDASAIQILVEIVADYHARSIDVCFVKLREANKNLFLKSGLLGELVTGEKYFQKVHDAMSFLAKKVTIV